MRAALPHQLNNFDTLRLTAALLVLVSHQHALTGMREPSVLNAHSLGGLGVLIFFSISGFLVAQSWQTDPSVWRFTLKRLLRIWPALAVAVVLAALVLGPMVSSLPWREYYASPLIPEYFKNLRFELRDQLPMRFEGSALPTAVNGSLWTIPLELKCYIALAVLGLAGLLRQRWLMLALLLLVTATYDIAMNRGDGFAEFFNWRIEQRLLLEFGLFFFAGTMFQAFALHRSSLKVKSMLLGACWVLAGLALYMQRPLLALWLALPTTVLLFGNASTPFLRRSGRFGDLSYGMYIYAFPVQQTLIWLYKDSLPWGVLLGLTVAVTSLLAFASWHLVEKWALRFKPGKRPQKTMQIDANTNANTNVNAEAEAEKISKSPTAIA